MARVPAPCSTSPSIAATTAGASVAVGRLWGAPAHEEVGVRSALSYRLAVLDHSETTAALNIYSEQPDAFDETSVNTGLVLATHASLLITAMLARDRADHLARALKSNREIGVAMGILMQRHRLTREQAFDILCIASQDANRKLADIATEVADTGILTIRRWPGSTTPTSDGSAGDWAPVQDGAPGAGSRFSSVLDTPGGTGARTAGSEPATSAVQSGHRYDPRVCRSGRGRVWFNDPERQGDGGR